MVDVGIALAASHNGAPPGGARPVGRRKQLPGGRAVVGGLLVAASAVGLFAAYTGATAGPSSAYVTVAHDIRPGAILRTADLRLVRIELPAAQRAVSFTDRRRLVGTVALARMRAGELVQSADVAEVSSAGRRAEISVAVEPANAMNGDRAYLRGGERVDVIVTVTSGGTPVTRTVARDVMVVDVLTGDRALGTSGALTVVLAVERADLESIAGANAVGKITLARTTGLAR
jgi:Flp pilus assembly protein CpaB